VSEGWVCRKCGASLAPHVEACPCSPPQTHLRLDSPTALPFPGSRITVAAAPQTDRNGTASSRSNRSSNAANDRSNAVAGKVLDLEPKTSTPQPRRRNDYTDPAFQRFWDVYPFKREKLAAARAWKRYVVDAGVDVDAVIAAAARYRDAADRDPNFTKYPQGWISGGRWEDAATAERPASHVLSATDREAQRAEEDAAIAAMESA